MKEILKKKITGAALIMALLLLLSTAEAMQFNPTNETTIDFDVTLTYGAGWRVSDRDNDKRFDATNPNPFTSNLNADDANENFDQWSMINNKVTALADIDIKHRNFGLFIRPKIFYDHVYKSDNDNSSPDTSNVFQGGLTNQSDAWSDEVEDIHGWDADILDLFASADFRIGEHRSNLRVGRQVISWGESFLIGGISSAQSVMDISAAVATGTEVKEMFLPTESVHLQFELTDTLALNSYYQWKWEKNKLMEGGTFFSRSDFMDDINAPILLAPGAGMPQIARGSDVDADDNGQFGVGLTWVWDKLNATEFGLYYMNYHDKNPTVNLDMAGGSYHLSYLEDIQLYGLSFSTEIADINFSGEVSFRKDAALDGFDPTAIGDYWQAQVSWFYLLGVRPFADTLTIVGEVACGETDGIVNELSYKDEAAWKYVLSTTFDWLNVANNLNMGLSLNYSDNPSGSNAFLGSEGSASASVGVNFLYKNSYKASIVYEERFDGIGSNDGDVNPHSDRDTLELSLSYTF